MAEVKKIKKINVATAAFPLLVLSKSPVQRYKIYGTKELSANITIDPSGTYKEGMIFAFDYSANMSHPNDAPWTFTLFGTIIPDSYLNKKLKIFCEYLGSGWVVFILPSVDTLPWVKLESIDPEILDGTTLTHDGTTGLFKIKDAGVTVDQLADDAVETAKIKAKAVELTKLMDLTYGYILVGDSGARPVLFDASGEAKFLIGSGTTLQSLAITEDITIDKDGKASISERVITAIMVGVGVLLDENVSEDAGLQFIKMEDLDANVMVMTNSDKKIVPSAYANDLLDVINEITPGTMVPEKAIIPDASGKVDALEVTAFTIDGEAVDVGSLNNKKKVKILTPSGAPLSYSLEPEYDIFLCDSSAYQIDITFGLLSATVQKTWEFKRLSGGNDVVFQRSGGDEFSDLTNSDVASITLTSTTYLATIAHGISKYQQIR